MSPIFGVLIALAVLAIIAASWYYAWIKPMQDRKKIANKTPIEAQVRRFENIFTGKIEVSVFRAEFRLRDEDLNAIASRYGYAFARYFQDNQGSAREIIFRRIDAGPGRQFGRVRQQ